MKTLLTALGLAAALLLVGGCDSANKTAADDPSAPPAPARTEAQPDNGDEGTFAFLKFWNWFDSDEPASPEPASVEAAPGAAPAEPYSTPGREPFTYVERKKEKTFTDYLLPWKWFESDDEVEASVAEFDDFEEAEVAVESENEGGPFDFLMFWKKDKDEKRKPITFDDVLDDMSPELVTMSETKPETRIRRAKVLDYNGRGIWDDLNDIMFFDRPTRMTLSPSP